jgi:hypothetical protein
MKTLLKVVGVLAAVLLVAVLAAFLFPRTYKVERAAVINARPDIVFAQVADLKSWKNWSVWHERDPAMKLSYSEPATGVGAWSAWESKSQGNGKMTFTAVEPVKRVGYKLEFVDMNSVSTGAIDLQPADKGVRVTWVMDGDAGMNPLYRWFALFCDKMIGPDFEQGLAKLKSVAEAAK